ncbi:MAG TPA: hypothetical protein VK177_02470 [Flavobacteriales bacterium]|nr:hypothetical protein [Flavobacteriales bacterium]
MDQKNLKGRFILYYGLLSAFFCGPGISHAQKLDPKTLIDTNETVVSPFEFLVLRPGDMFPQTWFYDTTGNRISTNDIFKGKPVIFITGSYTCPGFRNNTQLMNIETRKKARKFDVYFVYLHEAHPTKGSPYGPKMDSFIVNNYDSIFMEQQKILGQRMENALKSKQKFMIQAPVLIDNEHNHFFLQVMSAPNGYMEFSASGVLIKQRDWYNNKQQMKMLKKRRRKEKHKMKPNNKG